MPGFAAAAAWRDGTASIGCVIDAVRGGRLGDDAMGGHIVVGGDLNMHIGTGDDAVFAGWVSKDTRRCERGVQFAALCEQWRVRPVNDWSARARTTYTHGVSTRSVLDYIIMDEDLADLITQVRVLGGTKEYHSLDPILAGGDGHRWVEASVQLPVESGGGGAPKRAARSPLPALAVGLVRRHARSGRCVRRRGGQGGLQASALTPRGHCRAHGAIQDTREFYYPQSDGRTAVAICADTQLWTHAVGLGAQ